FPTPGINPLPKDRRRAVRRRKTSHLPRIRPGTPRALKPSRRDTMIALKRILVATDFGPAAEAALIYGRALAKDFGATLTVMHVAENFFLRATVADPHALKAAVARRLEERLTAEDRSALRARTVLETSDQPADAITTYAKQAEIDLIVMGTHG